VRRQLNIDAMADAAPVLEGRHDFTAFGRTSDRSPVRTVYAVRVRRDGHLVTIDVRADSFLRGQVRRMVAGLLEVGLERTDASGLRAALAGREPALNGATAPAKGLCLRRVVIGRRQTWDDEEDEE
jgi:tRNA pseudouridine38-40 synthase